MYRDVVRSSFLLAMVLLALACGGTDQDPTDGDAPDGDTPDGDLVEDGDTDEEEDDPLAPSGVGSCTDPLVHPGDESQSRILDGWGYIEDFSGQVDTSVCQESGDDDAVVGLGPEVVVRVSLKAGDRVSVNFIGDDYNAVVMIRQNLCATGSGCVSMVDTMGSAGLESLTMVAPEVGNYFFIFDSTDLNPTGLFSYHIEIKSVDDTTGAGDGLVGAACSAGTECVTNFCLTTTLLAWLVQPEEELEIRNGYCTAVLCHVDGSDGSCPPSSGGLCIPIPEEAGALFKDKGVCLDLCESDMDCRIEDDMRCFDPQEFVDQGLLDKEIKDTLYADMKACLPLSLIQAAAQELREM